MTHSHYMIFIISANHKSDRATCNWYICSPIITGNTAKAQGGSLYRKLPRFGKRRCKGDTVFGQDAHLVTLVDRKSRYTLLGKLDTKHAETVADKGRYSHDGAIDKHYASKSFRWANTARSLHW